jgi:hypothetical protein
MIATRIFYGLRAVLDDKSRGHRESRLWINHAALMTIYAH